MKKIISTFIVMLTQVSIPLFTIRKGCRNKFGMTAVMVLCWVSGFSQAPNWVWVESHTANGDGGEAVACVTTDASGNVFVAGTFTGGSITFGSTTLVNANIMNDDIFLVKFDASGNALWAVSAGGTGNEGPYSICTDVFGNVFITGYYYSSSITFGSTTLINAGIDDLFLAGYDAAGNPVWATSQTAGGTAADVGMSVCSDASGNILLTGSFWNSITFGSVTLTGAGGPDMFLVKYGPSGNVLWATSAGGFANDWSTSICTDVAGNILITGRFNGTTIVFGSTTLTNIDFFGYDMFLVKYNSSGSVLWAKRAGGNADEFSGSVGTDASANIIISGHFNSTSFPFGADTLHSAGNYDMFLLKYDMAGNMIWCESAGGAAYDDAPSVSVSSSGDIVTAGSFESTSIIFGSDTLNNAGQSNIFIVKYNSSGNVLWTKLAGADYYDGATAVCRDVSGNIFVGGYFNSSVVTFGSITLNNAGISDMFIGNLGDFPTDIVTTEVQQINLSPNPATSEITVNSSKFRVESLEVYDVVGRLTPTPFDYAQGDGQSERSRRLFVDVSKLAPGIYFVKMKSKEGERVGKFVKQ